MAGDRTRCGRAVTGQPWPSDPRDFRLCARTARPYSAPVNKWKDDEHRNKMHRRGILRRVRASLKVLLAVLGWVTLTLAAFLAGLALRESFSTRTRLLEMAGGYAAIGGGLVLLHALIFLLPPWLENRRSFAHQRRSQEARGRRRSSSSSENAPAPARSRDGMALVLVLVALALLSTLIVQTQLTARALARHTAARLSHAQLTQAAGDAARAALQRLAEDPDLLVDTTNEAWAVTEELTRPDGIATRTRVTDAQRQFDLNNLAVAAAAPAARGPGDILFDLFSLCGDFSSSAHLSALGDWTDADSEGLREAIAYARREPPYEPPNRYLFGWEESLHAEGGDRSRYRPRERTSTLDAFNAELADCLTVLPYGRTRPLPININTASPTVLEGVLGLGQDTLTRTILTLRTLKPIRAFESLAAVAEPGMAELLRPYVAVRSEFFRVEVQAAGPDRTVQLHVLAHRSSAGAVQIVQWLF